MLMVAYFLKCEVKESFEKFLQAFSRRTYLGQAPTNQYTRKSIWKWKQAQVHSIFSPELHTGIATYKCF